MCERTHNTSAAEQAEKLAGACEAGAEPQPPGMDSRRSRELLNLLRS